jgi:hypothetical protein
MIMHDNSQGAIHQGGPVRSAVVAEPDVAFFGVPKILRPLRCITFKIRRLS